MPGSASDPPEGTETRLIGCSPNPFFVSTRIRFYLQWPAAVALSVFDLSGRLMKTLREGPGEAGQGVAVWDGTRNDGGRVGPGVYFVQLSCNGRVESQRIVALVGR